MGMERRNFLKTAGGALFGTTALAAGTAQGARDIGVMNFRDIAGVLDEHPDLDLVRVENKYNPFKKNWNVFRVTLQFEDHADGWFELHTGHGGNNGRQFRLRADGNGQETLTFKTRDWVDSLYTIPAK